MEGLNKNIVCDFYKALETRDIDTLHHLLAPNIDWWFHGPPAHKYNLMQLFTGTRVFDDNNYSYKPLVVVGIGSMVVAEGFHVHKSQKTYWVHVWKVENGKIITEVREYLDTFVRVTRIRKTSNVYAPSPQSPKCKNMWESELVYDASVPRLLLVI